MTDDQKAREGLVNTESLAEQLLNCWLMKFSRRPVLWQEVLETTKLVWADVAWRAEALISKAYADEIARLTASNAAQARRIADLEGALKPFASVSWPPSFPDSAPGNTSLVTVGEYRRATATLNGEGR